MSAARQPPGSLHARYLRLRRAVGQLPAGRALKRALGREARIPVPQPPDPARLLPLPEPAGAPTDADILSAALRDLSAAPRVTPPLPTPVGAGTDSGSIRNVLFISHCDFTGNSALHVLAMARELHARGLSPAIAVPERPETVDDVGRPPFPVLTYADAATDALRFPDGRGVDLVHAFTPRELVREATIAVLRRHGCRYLVHLEDDDTVVVSAELEGVPWARLRELPLPELDRIIQPRQMHPLRGARFLEAADGITVLIDRLLELVPAGVPAAIVRAGFDEAVLGETRPREAIRAELGIAPADLAIAYTGNVHSVNRDEMRSLYAAVARLRRDGLPAVLVKTGWGSGVAAASFPSLGAGLLDLGWVARERVWDVLAAADVLVQPGGPSPFNDYRFPSKLPEYLASGRPVVLPRTNVGLVVRDGVEALVLERGDEEEIAAAVSRLAADPELRERLGAAGKAFALQELRWGPGVDRLVGLLGVVSRTSHSPAAAWELEGADPPAWLTLRIPAPPPEGDRHLLRSSGFRSVVEGNGPEPPVAYAGAMRAALGSPKDGTRVVPFPAAEADVPLYEAWLRKAVLRAAALAPVREPVVVVDPAGSWDEPAARARLLAASRAGLAAGVRQHFASRGLRLSEAEALALVSST